MSRHYQFSTRNRPVWAFVAGALASSTVALAQPNIDSWLLNCTGLTGYNGYEANVQAVQYDASFLYISASGIPAYSIGPWPSNPSVPSDQNYVFKIVRNPTPESGTHTPTPLGSIGVWINGVPIFNAKDAQSYNNMDIWHQNAKVVEGAGMDSCYGHPAPGMGPNGNSQGRYHHHRIPICLFDAVTTTAHSPLIGFGYDGYPVYGPYGYSNTNGTGGIRTILSSYRLRNITQRHTLPDGTVLSPAQYGPDVSVTYPLGYYIEDFEYVPGLGDLDQYNGRTAVTPEYPAGTYAYYTTLDNSGNEAYPYTLAVQYYGQVTLSMTQDHSTTPGGVSSRNCPAAEVQNWQDYGRP